MTQASTDKANPFWVLVVAGIGAVMFAVPLIVGYAWLWLLAIQRFQGQGELFGIGLMTAATGLILMLVALCASKSDSNSAA